MKHVEHAGMAEHGMACILYADPVWLHHLFADLRVRSTISPQTWMGFTIFRIAFLRVILTSIFLGHWAFLAGMGLS